MTIKRSSLPLGTPSATLIDSLCNPIPLGKEIGRGGEGSVFEVFGEQTLVAKVFHKRPLEDQVAKLEAMAGCWSSSLETISAWPRSLLFDPVSKKPCGIIISKMAGARPLHELYGTTNRRRHFPDVGWHHLVLAARNTAAAFQTLHSFNIVLGDVNQGNMLVDDKMMVRLIDCDSFQVKRGDRIFPCPVGTPHFTPPELQMLKLREVERTPNHDRFGLAVLIFHLLFVGRHPFAGRFRGAGDLSIEKAIAERRFAFSKYKAETLVDPPPASLLLDDLPPGIGDLFEAAFRGQNGEDRPSPIQWVEQLETLMKRRKACSYDAIHVYFAQLTECPWCRIEDSGGPAFFVPAAGVSGVSEDRLATLDDRIWKLKDVAFPELSAERIALPAIPPIKAKTARARFAAPDFTALSLAASWILCFAAPFFARPWALYALAAGSTLSLIYGLLLIVGKQASARRKTVDDFTNALETATTALTKRAQTMEYHHRQQEGSFDRTAEDLKGEIDRYRHAGENLRDVIAQNQETHKADYLRQFLIRDYGRRIPTLTASQVTMLESYSVESANDVTRLKLYGIPSIDPETVMELMDWRTEVERGFVFNPDHGITLADVGALKDAAVRRFKISQARKILTAARQLDSLADIGRTDLARSLVAFDDASDQWRNTARQLQEFEQSRRLPERWINRSWMAVTAWMLGVPFAASILYLIVR